MAVEEKKTRRVRKKLWKNDPVTITFANKDSICIDTDNDIFITDPKEIEAYLSPREIGNLEIVGSDANPNDYLSQPYPNLLLKGNNLIALHSLKSRFQNKVKLIYIDPPYNTRKDTFKYNDNFNHSTWLTFMKNRLQIAKELMRDDGVIFISIDDNEQAYLKVLCDEIFGKENFVGCLAVVNNLKGRNDATHFKNAHEYVLSYQKGNFKLGQFELTDEQEQEYCMEDEFGLYKKGKAIQKTGDAATRADRPNLFFSVFVDKNDKIYLEKPKDIHTQEVIPLLSDGSEGRWTWGKKKFIKDSSEIIVSRHNNKITLYKKQRLDLEDGIQRGKDAKTILYKPTYNTGAGVEELSKFTNKIIALEMKPKAEYLMHDIIHLSTKEGDLVLDFFAGSGTTLAVAHKMGRRWIGVEQMDYVESITKERLKKVIEGEQGGMSKTLQWNGGGEFVYAEIIDSAPNTATLQALEDCELEQKEDKIYNNFEDYLKDLENDK